MKKLIAITTLLIILLSSYAVYSSPPGFSGGVNDEYEYVELVFITGRPIRFAGGYKVQVSEKADKKTITYTFNKLKPINLPIEAEMNKKLKYTIEYSQKNDNGQTISKTTIELSEEIKVDKDKYKLEKVDFKKSDIIDNCPALDFYTGNFFIRKQYSINKNEGKVVIEGTGTNMGYENFWGNTETQLIDYKINYNRRLYLNDPKEDPYDFEDILWRGTVSIKTSDSESKSLKNWQNEVGLSSFNRGYVKVTNRDMVSEYNYDLPRMKREYYGYNAGNSVLEIPDESDKRNKGTTRLTKSMLPQMEHLMVPKFRDTVSHWAQDYVEKLYSLGVFEGEGEFFEPDAPMTRQEFARAVIKACNIRLEIDTKKKSSSKNKSSEVSLFSDVDIEDPDYAYIKEAVNKGIIQGNPDGTFAPIQPLTRAQAAAIFIRTLGFERVASNPRYKIYFNDDDDIPEWARDSIYMASEIEIIKGDGYGNINPNQNLTRAEASAMLVRFLEFLEKDLQKSYRGDIMN